MSASLVCEAEPLGLHAPLTRALHLLHPTGTDYAHRALEDAFTWGRVATALGTDTEGDWFVVVFRSVRRADACTESLFRADAQAQAEAVQSGGLLGYFYGEMDAGRNCLAMCIWADREYARLAMHKPLHRQAAALAERMYESYCLERYALVKRRGARVFEFRPV